MAEPMIDYTGLTEEDILSWESSTISRIYPMLRGGLFHKTSVQGYRGIQDKGQIIPNTGQFTYTYPQSQHYLAGTRGYVALFDFQRVRDQDCIGIRPEWGGFFFDQKPVTIVLRLNRGLLSDKLIANGTAPQLGDPGYRQYIPFVEAWYPEPIPFDAIESFIVTAHRFLDNHVFVHEFSKSQVCLLEELLSALSDN